MTKKTLTSLVVVIVLASALFILYNERELANWDTFVSEDYHFEISYPVDNWNFNIEPDYLISPRFNFFIVPSGVVVEEAFDHFANITNVSVYPEGIPTEGLMSQTEPLSEDWGDNIDYESSTLYTLEDGTPFAAYVRFNNAPSSWEDWGYAWIRLRADNLESVCFRDGVEVNSDQQCDPLGNESITIAHRGDVDEDMWPVLVDVLKSLKFNQ